MSDNWDADKVRIQVARDLRAIVELYGQLPAEAEHRGDPTGEAVLLLGNVGNVEAFGWKIDAAKDASHAADQVELDALFVLGSWEEVVREERDQPSDLRARVDRAADYLRDSVDWMLSDDEHGNMRFLGVDQMATELAAVRNHLENVLKAGDRSDKGVPCMTCSVALVKVWGATEPDDRWRCGPCDQWSTQEQYELAVKQDYLRNAEWLTADDMAAQWRIPVGTVKSWAQRGRLQKKRNDAGRMTYDVAAAKRLRDEANERIGA